MVPHINCCHIIRISLYYYAEVENNAVCFARVLRSVPFKVSRCDMCDLKLLTNLASTPHPALMSCTLLSKNFVREVDPAPPVLSLDSESTSRKVFGQHV